MQQSRGGTVATVQGVDRWVTSVMGTVWKGRELTSDMSSVWEGRGLTSDMGTVWKVREQVKWVPSGKAAG